MKKYTRVPNHVGIIPDGNRRWAVAQGLDKNQGYEQGVEPGAILCDQLCELGVKEVTFYGFTKDNNKRPAYQRQSFTQACVDSVRAVSGKNYDILVVGNTDSDLFPAELLDYTRTPKTYGDSRMRINFLINYDWKADLEAGFKNKSLESIMSREISRMELIVRWGGKRRLSGFLPVQSVYSDFYVVDKYWPAFAEGDIHEAMAWYQECDPTLGG